MASIAGRAAQSMPCQQADIASTSPPPRVVAAFRLSASRISIIAAQLRPTSALRAERRCSLKQDTARRGHRSSPPSTRPLSKVWPMSVDKSQVGAIASSWSIEGRAEVGFSFRASRVAQYDIAGLSGFDIVVKKSCAAMTAAAPGRRLIARQRPRAARAGLLHRPMPTPRCRRRSVNDSIGQHRPSSYQALRAEFYGARRMAGSKSMIKQKDEFPQARSRDGLPSKARPHRSSAGKL